MYFARGRETALVPGSHVSSFSLCVFPIGDDSRSLDIRDRKIAKRMQGSFC